MKIGMKNMSKVKAGIILACAVSYSLFVHFGIAPAQSKTFTIGILNVLSTHTPTVEGFKVGMAELGYIEGENVKYIYNGPIEFDEQIMDSEIKGFISQGMDLLVAVANGPALQAKKTVEGSDIPVLAAACGKMTKIGLLKNLKQPEGNITGVQVAENISKALEWLTMITPNAKKIYVPYDPEDDVSIINLAGLGKVADLIGVELVLQKVRSVEDAVAFIESLPKGMDAIFRVPSWTLGPRNSELSQAAIMKCIPLGSALPLDEAVLITHGSDLFEIGKQIARMAHQIRKGIKPSDLPVESSEVFLTINLRTANKIGLEIPDDILLLANRIIR